MSDGAGRTRVDSDFEKEFTQAVRQITSKTDASVKSRPPESVASFKKRIAILTASPSSSSPELAEEDHLLLDCRKDPITDLTRTETTFVSNLRTVVRVFVQPLKEARILSAFELASIFSNIEYILALNEDLVSKLNTLSELRSQDQIIGPIFFHFTEFIGVYLSFAENHPRALDTLSDFKKTNKKFGKFMEKALQSPDCGGQTLERFLDKTFSRLDYYANALKPVFDTTPSGHPDHSLLQTSLERLSAITQEIAHFKTILDHQKRINEASSCIEGLPEKLFSYEREFVAEEDVDIVESGKKKEKEKERKHIFFFNDLLVITKVQIKTTWAKPKPSYTFRETISLSSVLVRDAADVPGMRNRLELVRNDVQMILAIGFDTNPKKREWLNLLDTHINNHLERERIQHLKDRELALSQPIVESTPESGRSKSRSTIFGSSGSSSSLGSQGRFSSTTVSSVTRERAPTSISSSSSSSSSSGSKGSPKPPLIKVVSTPNIKQTSSPSPPKKTREDKPPSSRSLSPNTKQSTLSNSTGSVEVPVRKPGGISASYSSFSLSSAAAGGSEAEYQRNHGAKGSVDDTMMSKASDPSMTDFLKDPNFSTLRDQRPSRVSYRRSPSSQVFSQPKTTPGPSSRLASVSRSSPSSSSSSSSSSSPRSSSSSSLRSSSSGSSSSSSSSKPRKSKRTKVEGEGGEEKDKEREKTSGKHSKKRSRRKTELPAIVTQQHEAPSLPTSALRVRKQFIN